MTDEPVAGTGPGASLAIVTFGSRTAAVGLAFGGSIVAARVLGPEDRGRYAVLITAATLATTLGHLSVEHGQIALWPREGMRSAIRSNAPWLGAVIGLCAGAVAAFLLLEALPAAVPGVSRGLVLVALVGVPLGVLALYMNSVLVLDRRVNVVNLAALLSSVAQVAVVISLAAIGRLTVAAAVLAWLTAVLITAALPLIALRPRATEASLRVAGNTLATGARYHGGMVALVLLLQVDILMVNKLANPAVVGIYALAVQLGSLAFLVTDAVSQVALPMQTNASLEDSAQLTARLVRMNAMLLVAILIPLAVSSYFLIPLVYGQAFAGTASALAALAPGILAFGIARAAGAYLIRLGRPWRISGLYISALVLNVLLNLMLVPRAGAVGASIASTAAYIWVLVVTLLWTSRSSPVPLGFLPGAADVRAVRLGLSPLSTRFSPWRMGS